MIIEFLKRRPNWLTDPPAAWDWFADALSKIVEFLKGLVLLDETVRRDRSNVAERAVLRSSAIVTNAAVIRFETLIPQVLIEIFTTAHIAFDAGSGAGRYTLEGTNPLAAATAAAGMPIPGGGAELVVIGILNIRSFAVIAETATNMNLSVTLYK